MGLLYVLIVIFKIMGMRIILLAFVLMLSINSYGQSGQDGNITWNIASGTLTISGTGAMKDYDYSNSAAPWIAHMSFVRKVVIQEGVSTIGSSAFALCTSVTSVEMPENITSIGGNAFSGCTGLLSINVDENNNVYKSIDGVMFSKDGNVLYIYPGGKANTSYTVPDHVTEIGYGAFLNCGNLVKVEISDGVQTIGRESFLNCQNLDTVIIPASITAIESSAFKYCNNLKTVEVQWQAPLPVSADVFPDITNAKLIVPDGTKAAYEAMGVWKDFGTIAEKSTTGNKKIDANEVNISIRNGQLFVNSPDNEKINIYTVTGSLVGSFVKNEGNVVFSVYLPNGIYIINSNKGWSVKVSKI